MPRSGLAPAGPAAQGAHQRLRIADVALWYGERSGGIRTYLDAKARHAAAYGTFEHHLVVPGRRRRTVGSRHELRALTLAASNGYRVPLGTGALEEELIRIRPEVILAHDPFWALPAATAVAVELDAKVIAVHHASAALEAAALPGPDGLYQRSLDRWRRRTYARVDAVMSAHTSHPRGQRTMPLRFGIDPEFRPRLGTVRGDHVLYAGRLSREKGVLELVAAVAASQEPFRLRIVGSGPARHAIEALVRRHGLRRRVEIAPHVADRAALAEEYRRAACVVMPGQHETFGLVALEAAACGTPVVAANCAPAARAADELCETFEPGDVNGLLAAIDRQRHADPDPALAADLARDHTWERALSLELANIEGLLR
jgi:alpha-1,6-mannosyltransferase